MRNLENAVTDTLEELELEEHIEHDIHELREGILYHVTFRERENGNNQVVISVEYSRIIGDLLDDESWDGEVEVHIVRREGIGPMMSQMIMELLAITLDSDYFDSEEEEDDETLSTPRTPPPLRSSQPLTPPPLPRRLH